LNCLTSRQSVTEGITLKVRQTTPPLSTKDSNRACILKKLSLVICGKSELFGQFTVFG